VVGSYQSRSKPSGFIKCEEFLDQLRKLLPVRREFGSVELLRLCVCVCVCVCVYIYIYIYIYRVRINYRRILQNHIFTNTETEIHDGPTI